MQGRPGMARTLPRIPLPASRGCPVSSGVRHCCNCRVDEAFWACCQSYWSCKVLYIYGADTHSADACLVNSVVLCVLAV